MWIKWEIESLEIEFCDCDHLRKRRRDVTPRKKRPLATERRDASRALQNFIFSRSPSMDQSSYRRTWSSNWIDSGEMMTVRNWPCLFWPSVFPSHRKPHPALTQPRPVSLCSGIISLLWYHIIKSNAAASDWATRRDTTRAHTAPPPKKGAFFF